MRYHDRFSAAFGGIMTHYEHADDGPIVIDTVVGPSVFREPDWTPMLCGDCHMRIPGGSPSCPACGCEYGHVISRAAERDLEGSWLWS